MDGCIDTHHNIGSFLARPQGVRFIR